MAQPGAGGGGIGAPPCAGVGAPRAPPSAGLGAIGAPPGGVQPRFDIPTALTRGGPPKKSDSSFEIWDKR